ncbi:unnamed protein product [Thlaspi arvense]|uniref:Protein kinase domain-containing protein n=1 Tax=Thlaspi arvense TaxID=13288 RepID=A0AAU9RIS6_THLAR|nr:unnamed protein product [Thlaspi arvense]
MKKVRHPNVVQFVGAVTQNVPMMIVSEYHPRGDLASYLQKKGRLSPSKALKFSIDIARHRYVSFHYPNKGMNYLHGCKPDPIMHCDLKPKCQKHFAGLWRTVEGLYVAPEIYKDEIFDRSVDVYSFGLILYEMVEGVQPFHNKSPEEAAKLMCLTDRRPLLKTKSKHYPTQLKEVDVMMDGERLIEKCWHPDSAARPSFYDIIIQLNKIVANCSKHGWWKDTFKLPWKLEAQRCLIYIIGKKALIR